MKPKEWNTPEGQARRLVRVFQSLASEAHRSLIESTAQLTSEQFDAVIAKARRLGKDNGLRICPIVERPGWWTAYPTRRLAAKATEAAIERNKGEAQNNAEAYFDFGDITDWNAHDAKQQEYRLASFRAAHQELEIAPEFDYVLSRVDEAIGAGHGYVLLANGASEAA